MKIDYIEELKKIYEALSGYQGNELTHYRPLKTLMVEQRLEIIEGALVLLIGKILKEREANLP